MKVVYYICPVCQKSSTDQESMEKHFRQHTLIEEEWAYCKICKAGWCVKHYGKEAYERARECEKVHRAEYERMNQEMDGLWKKNWKRSCLEIPR